MRVEFQLITPAHSWPSHMCLFPIPPIFPTLLAARLRLTRHTQHLEYSTLSCLVNSDIYPLRLGSKSSTSYEAFLDFCRKARGHRPTFHLHTPICS